ncbi:cysteine desulfurase family protein [Taibaiella chishuiensis]|uniref:cysteine desulfurase n=1 Tax=Taibaiella chishuiensis TaxID=1434707 RepID=A0A2P8DBR6_9BACT|nr:cysteine desulfurase family protein [Taibaiella chishuiensis]PSK94668.1 cysteine desulfurase IscS [Taibaiella chishuiensis]
MIYLDYNATTPCDPEVVAAMLPYFSQKFGNAASKTHPYGWIADEAVEQARRQVARLIGATEQEVIFTSGSTEGCNLALKGVFELYAVKGNHIITCVTEHKAVLDTCQHLEQRGATVTYLPVDAAGLISLEELEAAIRPETILIAVMYANNETGVIQPVKAIGAIAKKHKVLFFSDATQAAGKLPLDVQTDGIDLLALSAHKLYGPKGVGALYIRRKGPRVSLKAQIDGGGHERGFRSGTLNVPGIAGLGKACSLCSEGMEAEQQRLRSLRDQLEQGLLQSGDVSVNGSLQSRMPHVSNLSFRGIKAERMISALNSELAFSVGSACTSASKAPSHVLEAMGLDQASLDGAIRFSLGRFTTAEEIAQTINLVRAQLDRLKY